VNPVNADSTDGRRGDRALTMAEVLSRSARRQDRARSRPTRSATAAFFWVEAISEPLRTIAQLTDRDQLKPG